MSNFEKNRSFYGAGTSGVYMLTVIGAAVYYFQQATTFLTVMLGFLKALVWPAMLIYKVFEMIKM